MNRKILAGFIFLLCAVSVSTAQELKGIWAGSFEADEVFAAVTVNFDESKIVLRFAGNEQAGAVKNLQIKDGGFSFRSETRPQADFFGKIENGKINGTFDMLRGDGTKSGSGVWNARKVDSLDFKADSNPTPSNAKPELPMPSGKFSTGRKFFYWTDESRLEMITDDPNDKRKVFVQLWYPTKKSDAPTAVYFPNLEEVRPNSKDSEFLRTLKTHTIQDAKPTKGKFPVLIFSPGLSSNPFTYTAIIENFVSQGYVVAAINHPFDTEDFKFLDGNLIRYATEKWDKPIAKDWTQQQRVKFFDERRFGWAKDVSFVVNQLEKLDKPFKDIFDWENLGHFGHSFGGQASSIVCASDTRFKACANLDGMAQGNVILPNEKGETMKQPFLFFNKSEEVTDIELKIMGLNRQEYRTREQKRLAEHWKPSFKTQLGEVESGSYFVLYPGVKHSSFSDWVLLDANSSVFSDRFSIAKNINEYTLAFFDKFLRKKESPLLNQQNKTPSPIILEFLKQKK